MAMSLAIIHSRALDGLSAPAVEVEVHLANGLPSFTLVGLADLEVKESRERVRAALQSAGLDFPANKRITVNLSPADLPKEGDNEVGICEVGKSPRTGGRYLRSQLSMAVVGIR